MTSWQANKLALSIRKTIICSFREYDYKSTIFLRVIIDDKLNGLYIQYIKSVSILYKCQNSFDKETMQNLDFSFICQYLTCCAEIWGKACNTQ